MNRVAQVYGKTPTEMLDMDVARFAFDMVMGKHALTDNMAPLDTMIRRAKKDDMAPGIAAAVRAGFLAGR